MESTAAAIEALKEGKTILYPTDTIWGIGCDATNEEACQKVFDVKKRPASKSFVLLADGFQMVEKYIPEFAPVVYELADLSESPLTIIYPAPRGLAPSVLAEDGTVAIRITKDPICLKLIRAIRKPIVATSANISGEKAPVSFGDISEDVKSAVDAIVMERLVEKMGTPSQIIKIGLDSSVKIIRE